MPKTTWTRRELMAKVGACAVLLAPALRSRTSRASTGPGRMLLMNFPNGSPGNAGDVFYPAGGASADAWDFTGRVTAPLSAFSDRATFVRGLRTNRGRRPKGSHGGGNICLLTGTNELNHLNTDFHTPQNESIDRYVAHQFREDALYLAVGLDDRANSRMSWVGDDQPNVAIDDPQTAFDLAFGGWSELCSADEAALRAHISRQTLVLDAITADLSSVKQTLGLVGEEREKLDQYADGLSDLQKELDALASGDACDPSQLPEIDLGEDSTAARMAALRKISVFALGLGVRRVVTLQLFHGYNGFNYGGLVEGVPSQGHHGLTHSSGSDAPGHCRAIVRWHAERLAEMLVELDGFVGESGSVLDDLTVLWGTDTPNAFTHAYGEDAPTLVLGGACGRLRGGVQVDVGERNHVDLLATLCASTGADGTLFETRTGFGGLLDGMLT